MLWRMSADTHRKRIGIMFNFRPTTTLPGFRVGLPDDVPGFNIDSNGLPRHELGDSSGQGPALMAPLLQNLIGPTNSPAYKFGVGLAGPSPPGILAAHRPLKMTRNVSTNVSTCCRLPGRSAGSEFRKCYRDCMGAL